MARTPATQLPFVKEPVARTGQKMFRVQVLPKGTVEHPVHGNLDFSGERLRELVERFKAGAMDHVPFLLASESQEHPRSGGDPDRVRGEVKGVELEDDGLYATVETTDRGAELLTDNPRLPVSVRVQEAFNGPFKGKEVLAHVLGTLDPIAKGMKIGWEPIDAAADIDLVDLSDGRFTLPGTVPETDLKPAELSEEDQGLLKKLLGRFKSAEGGEPAEPEGNGDGKTQEQKDAEEADRLLRELTGEPEPGKEAEPAEKGEPEPVALSAEDRKTLDLANSRAESAEQQARTATLKLGRTELSNRFKDYLEAGVPPAQIKAAQAQLKDDDQAVIDLANEKPNAETKGLFAVLDAARGTIDFSEIGKTTAEDDDVAEQRRKDAETAAKGYMGNAG